MTAFNIDTLAAAPVATLTLIHPATGVAIKGPEGDASITYYSPGSAEYVAAKAKQSNRWLGRMGKKGKPQQLTAAELDESKTEFLADITIGFNNFSSQRHAHLEGRAYFHAVYADPSFGFIVEQFDEHMGDYANFLTSSAQS